MNGESSPGCVLPNQTEVWLPRAFSETRSQRGRRQQGCRSHQCHWSWRAAKLFSEENASFTGPQSTVFLQCLFLTFTLSSETPPQCWGVLVRLHSAQRPQIRPLWTQQRSSHPRPLLRELRPAWCTRHSQKYTGTVS